MNLKSYSAIVLAQAGLLLASMGLYFIFLRPALLPEDLLYMGLTMQNVKEKIPGLLNWLQKVFWVLGSYIFTAGLLTVFISFTSFRTRLRGAFSIITLTGITSMGLANLYATVGNCVNTLPVSQMNELKMRHQQIAKNNIMQNFFQ